MGEIINVIKQVINSEAAFLFAVIGLVFIVIGVALGIFKPSWLHLQRSPFSYDESEYEAIFTGLLMGILGGIMFFGVFICTYFEIMDYFLSSFMYLALFAFLLAIFIVAVIYYYNKKYKKIKK